MLVYDHIFVTATNTNIGKTYVVERLIHYYSLFGFSVGVIKPIETGVKNGIPADGTRLFEKAKKYNPKLHKLSIDEIVPFQFELPAAPYIASGKIEIDIEKIKTAIKNVKQYCDILLIEGAGGLMVPINKNYFMIDLIKELNYKTLLVAPSYLGSINDTLLSIDKLNNSNVAFDWVINIYQDKDEFEKITKPFYDDYFQEFNIFQNNIIKLANHLIYRKA